MKFLDIFKIFIGGIYFGLFSGVMEFWDWKGWIELFLIWFVGEGNNYFFGDC
jgi:hypothetical protein